MCEQGSAAVQDGRWIEVLPSHLDQGKPSFTHVNQTLGGAPLLRHFETREVEFRVRCDGPSSTTEDRSNEEDQ